MSILNIAAYRFVSLNALPSLQTVVRQALDGSDIRGTVLLAEEGINLFLAGQASAVQTFLAWLRTDSRFATLEAKESWSEAQPFKKLLVKIKPEIIRMNHPAIAPAQGRAPAVDAATLKRWLDQGTDDRFILDNEDGFACFGTRSVAQRAMGSIGLQFPIVSRQVDRDCRALPDLAVDTNVTFRLFGEAIHHREAQPGALADALG